MSKSQQDLQHQYDDYQQTISSLNEKLVQLDGQISEHEIVLDTLRSVPQDRKCYRMINDALVESTSGESVAKLNEIHKGLKEASRKLDVNLKDLQKEFVDWKVKNKVKIYKAN